MWQVLCLAASLMSVTAVVANGFLSAAGFTGKIADARACDSPSSRGFGLARR